MDTRSKIVAPETLSTLNLRAPVVATGYFDVLGPGHVAELEALAGVAPLVVLVVPLEGEFLTQRARAELVAALRAVDYVIAAEGPDPCRIIGLLQPSRVARLEAADLRRRCELIADVRRRHHA